MGRVVLGTRDHITGASVPYFSGHVNCVRCVLTLGGLGKRAFVYEISTDVQQKQKHIVLRVKGNVILPTCHSHECQ